MRRLDEGRLAEAIRKSTLFWQPRMHLQSVIFLDAQRGIKDREAIFRLTHGDGYRSYRIWWEPLSSAAWTHASDEEIASAVCHELVHAMHPTLDEAIRQRFKGELYDVLFGGLETMVDHVTAIMWEAATEKERAELMGYIAAARLEP